MWRVLYNQQYLKEWEQMNQKLYMLVLLPVAIGFRWILADHTGSFPKLVQNVLPPPSSPERRCGVLAGPGQREQRWAVQWDPCWKCQSLDETLSSLRASAAVQSLRHTGTSWWTHFNLKCCLTKCKEVDEIFFPQIPSGYYIQAMNSNLHLTDLLLPIGAMNVIGILPLLLLAPVMEFVTTYFLSMEKTPPAPARVISKSAKKEFNFKRKRTSEKCF